MVFTERSLMLLTGEVNYDMLRRAMRAGITTKPILFASGGGDTAASRALYDWLAGSRPTMIGTGEIASAALPVFIAGGRRFCTESTTFLWHEPFGDSLDSTMSRELMALYASSMTWWYTWACERLAENSKISTTEWRRLGRGAGEEFSAYDALKWGVVEAVVTQLDFAAVLTPLAGGGAPTESEPGDEKPPE